MITPDDVAFSMVVGATLSFIYFVKKTFEALPADTSDGEKAELSDTEVDIMSLSSLSSKLNTTIIARALAALLTAGAFLPCLMIRASVIVSRLLFWRPEP